MIFITVGSQKFQFDRLLRAVDELLASGNISEPVFAQIGYSQYQPCHYRYEKFLDQQKFAECMDRADVIITHGGSGAIMKAVKKGKKVIAVPRLARYGEHVDDHQLQLIAEFSNLNLIYGCSAEDDLQTELKRALKIVRNARYNTYESNTQKIIDNIEKYIEQSKGV